MKFIRNRVAQWCAGSRDHARSRRKGGLWSIFLRLYFYYFNPSGRCFGCAPVVIRDSNVKQVTTQGACVCVEHEKCGSFHVADDRKLDWDGLRDPLKSCILPFPAGRYFSHPVASALKRTMLFRQVKISCYSTKGNERGQSARLVTRPGKKKENHGCCPQQRSGQGGGGSTRNGERETDRKGKVV